MKIVNNNYKDLTNSSISTLFYTIYKFMKKNPNNELIEKLTEQYLL